MSEQKRGRTRQADRKATRQLAKPPAPPVPPAGLPSAAAAETAALTVAPRAREEALTGPSVRALRAHLTFTAELSAEWCRLLLVASRSACLRWTGKV